MAVLMLCLGMAAQAQSGEAVTVSGKVIDAQGEPLPGVSVGVKGTTVGAMTGVDGRFSLRVSGEKATLVF
ncbi:MAG: carboxypeptidase-like regulatory domain-containing protein, partial [Prevotellaceae bacterium]|nr:carboxypeptidase-like regulatory domain-containing protein [Prevotellaceae bacterium]